MAIVRDGTDARDLRTVGRVQTTQPSVRQEANSRWRQHGALRVPSGCFLEHCLCACSQSPFLIYEGPISTSSPQWFARNRESQRRSKAKTAKKKEKKKCRFQTCRFLFARKTRKIIMIANSIITCARHSSELSLYTKQVLYFLHFINKNNAPSHTSLDDSTGALAPELQVWPRSQGGPAEEGRTPGSILRFIPRWTRPRAFGTSSYSVKGVSLLVQRGDDSPQESLPRKLVLGIPDKCKGGRGITSDYSLKVPSEASFRNLSNYSS